MDTLYDRTGWGSVAIPKNGKEGYLRALSVVACWRQDGYGAHVEERRDRYVVRKAAAAVLVSPAGGRCNGSHPRPG